MEERTRVSFEAGSFQPKFTLDRLEIVRVFTVTFSTIPFQEETTRFRILTNCSGGGRQTSC